MAECWRPLEEGAQHAQEVQELALLQLSLALSLLHLDAKYNKRINIRCELYRSFSRGIRG